MVIGYRGLGCRLLETKDPAVSENPPHPSLQSYNLNTYSLNQPSSF